MKSLGVFFHLVLASVAVDHILLRESNCTFYQNDNNACANCSHKHLNHLPSVPTNTTVLDLSYNNIKQLKNKTCTHLQQLTYLNLSSNGINSLEPTTFEDCRNLLHLDLSNNNLVVPNISALFDSLVHLRFLNLKNNSKRYGHNSIYPDRLFRHLTDLETLKIDVFGFPNFGAGTGNLTALKNLVLGGEHCYIYNLSREIFEPFSDIALDHLDISHCYTTSIEEDVFKPLKNLTRLTLRHSPVGVKQALHALSPFVGRKMHKLDLHKIHSSTKNLALVKINDSIIHKKDLRYLRGICVKDFHLSHNLLLFIQSTSLRNSTFANCIMRLFLGVNSFFYQPWPYLLRLSYIFTNIEEFDISSQVHVMKRIPRMYFAGLDMKKTTSCSENEGKPVQNVSFSVPPKLQKLNLAALTYNFDSLFGNIHVNNATGFWKLNMSFLGLTEFCYEISGLVDLAILDLSGNPELSLKDSFFETFPNVTYLYMDYFSLPQDAIDKQGKRLLRPLKKLQYLSISSNSLKCLPKMFFVANPQLKYLDVSNNLFTIIPFSIHLTPKMIKVDIRFNSIEYIDYKGRLQIDNHIQKTGMNFHLFLEGNDLICDCTSFNFLVWLTNTHTVLDDRGKYNCFLSNGEKSTIAKEITDKAIVKSWRKCLGVGLFYMALTLFIMTVATILVALLVKTNKTVLFNFFYKIFDSEITKAKKTDFRRDVYISYAEEDYQWVCHHLCPALEKRHLSLFIWDRDSVPGDSIPDQIVENVQSCWKILLYYTENFQKDPWTYMSIMAAINSVDDFSPEKVLLLLPEHENPRVPNCLLEVIPESCIIRVPDGACYDGSEDLWETISNKVKQD